ncbi:unnamed protein product, partial [Mesorhabditis belari]|uniref:Protein YIPF n=1 Tax=Mesorhabditis belari TaxID=2138241 RepID=A0AAF3F274_9BILA
MSLIDTDPAIHSPRSGDMQQPGSAFGSAAVDIEKLEKEIAAQENARRERAQLTGAIGSNEGAQKPASFSNGGPRRGLQEVSLETSDDLDTLDEPVIDTIKRDVRTIGAKFGQVLLPRVENRDQLLRDWDLWGPLFICVALSLLLHHNSPSGAAPAFTQVFCISFFGSVALTINIKLLGGTISFFQSLCVIGYCLLPPTGAAFLCTMFFHKWFVVRLLVTSIGYCWATYATMGFLSSCVSEKRRLLVVYPIFLFYFIVSWLIISHS